MSMAEHPDVMPIEAATAARPQGGAAATPARRSDIGRIGLLAYVITFALVCVIPLAGLALGFENPNLEKRALSPLPGLLAEGRPNLEAMSAFDKYFADHFAFRTRLVTGWHQFNQMLLGQSGSTKVIAGKSGWLFYAETLPDYLASPLLDDADLRRLATTLSLQREYLAAMGIDFQFAVAPNKNTIYGQYMPDRYQPVQGQNNLARWLSGPYARTVPTIDLVTPLRQAAAAGGTPIYHRTDSHWNNLGARVGYETLMAAATGQKPRLAAEDFGRLAFETRADWQGDLAVMLSPAGVEPDQQQYFNLPARYRSLRPIRSFEDMLIQTTLPAGSAQGSPDADRLVDAGGRKLWMFRDSFANALVPLLANSFSAATFSREVPYNYTGIDKSKADVVILEIVERNLPQLLMRAPVFPAPERPAPPPGTTGPASPAAGGASQALADRLLAESDGRLLKLAGRLSGDAAALSTVDRIYVGLNNSQGTIRYLEATPIDETAHMGESAATGTADPAPATIAVHAAGVRAEPAATLGLTSFVQAGGWLSGSQIVEIWYHRADGWRQARMSITLP